MLIHRVDEGEKSYYGLNWRSNKMTFFSIKLVLPIWLVLPSEYEDFDSRNTFYGWRVKKLCLRLRIRRWKEFPKKIRKILYSASTNLCSIGKQTLISTYEQKVDGY